MYSSHLPFPSALIFLLFVCACGETRIASESKIKENLLVSESQLLLVRSASPEECSTGGTTVVSYTDNNKNSVFDDGDIQNSLASICNGATGSQGFGAGIVVENANTQSCPAGGSLIRSFIDKNNDSQQQQDEPTTSVSTVCNGVAGTDGADGKSVSLSVTLANASQCPNGGAVYTSTNSGDENETVSVVCNGQNASSDPAYAMGAVGPMVSGKSYSACHHDYLFFPDPSGGNRGWLTFRHQFNGSADQGIGTTGFQVWNIDISHFYLASEVGSVNYCELWWNPATLQLKWKVLDNTDQLAGQEGSIQL